MTRGYIILNIIRVCSITALVMATTAALATLVKSFIMAKYFLFDVLNNIILSVFCALLFFSELDLFPSYYEKRWPLLGPSSSLVGVGIAEIIVGFQLIGNLNERNASKETIGYSFNTLLMAAGIIVSAMGVVVFIASYVYSNSQTHTTARTFRSKAYSSSGGARASEPIVRLEDVRVLDRSSELERPQRTYSQSSRRAPSRTSTANSNYVALGSPSEGGIERSTSAASSRGPFPYASRVPSSGYSEPSNYMKENQYSPPRNPYA